MIMILKEIGKLCQTRKKIAMVRAEDSSTQWIGDGCGLYCVGGLSIGSVSDLMTVFDYPEKTRDVMQCSEQKEISGINLHDEDSGEIPAEISPLTVKSETELLPVFAGGMMMLIRAQYLRPLRDAKKPGLLHAQLPHRSISGGEGRLAFSGGDTADHTDRRRALQRNSENRKIYGAAGRQRDGRGGRK